MDIGDTFGSILVLIDGLRYLLSSLYWMGSL